uniref:Uncharacterized protein n=1 Tax=Salix viminalis TaxID=40686 RepID=A0A6N2KTA0_SALVM
MLLDFTSLHSQIKAFYNTRGALPVFLLKQRNYTRKPERGLNLHLTSIYPLRDLSLTVLKQKVLLPRSFSREGGEEDTVLSISLLSAANLDKIVEHHL